MADNLKSEKIMFFLAMMMMLLHSVGMNMWAVIFVMTNDGRKQIGEVGLYLYVIDE